MTTHETSAPRARQRAVALLRAGGLLPTVDALRFALTALRSRKDNRAFGAQRPGAPTPPAGLMYDAYGHVSLATYEQTGAADAAVLAGLIRQYGRTDGRVLDWGCGPGRVLRALRAELPQARLYGADVNARSIAWLRDACPDLTVAVHGAMPPLPFDERFDAIIGLSVLTHFSSEQHVAWTAALRDALAPGGLLILTTHGVACVDRLLPGEAAAFNRGELVVRGNVQRGTRCFVAYHPPTYMRGLLQGMEVLAHIEHNPSAHAKQDIWVARMGAGS
jgi:SAM-dependent methyltransferase